MQDDFYSLPPHEIESRLGALACDALPHFGISTHAAIALLGHRENAVFQVREPNGGRRFALRIHRPGYQTVASIRSELNWTAALTESGVACPAAVPTRNGEPVLTLEGPSVQGPRNIVVFEWAKGSSPTGEHLVPLFLSLGEICARIHDHGRNWTAPDDFTRQRWDADGLFGETTHWGRYQDLDILKPNQIALLNQARNVAHVRLLTYTKTRQNFGLIHADLLPDNLLVDGEHVQVIDFDDCGHGWFVHDLATAMFYHQNTAMFEPLRDAWVEGYRHVSEMEEEDLALIDLFLLGRGMANLGWRHTRGLGQSESSSLDWLIDTTCGLAERITNTYGSGS